MPLGSPLENPPQNNNNNNNNNNENKLLFTIHQIFTEQKGYNNNNMFVINHNHYF